VSGRGAACGAGAAGWAREELRPAGVSFLFLYFFFFFPHSRHFKGLGAAWLFRMTALCAAHRRNAAEMVFGLVAFSRSPSNGGKERRKKQQTNPYPSISSQEALS